jgi:hypothetical protein
MLILRPDAREGIRTPELLQDWTLNPAPLTWLGNPRFCPVYWCWRDIEIIACEPDTNNDYISTLVTTPWILSDGSL